MKHNLTFEESLKKHDRYLKAICNSFRMETEFDDLLQEARIQYWHCYHNFDPAKTTQGFDKYFPIQVKYALYDYLSDNSRTIRLPRNIAEKEVRGEIERIKVQSLDKTFDGDDDENRSFLNTIPYEEYDSTPKQNLALKRAISKLKPKHQDIVLRHVGLDSNWEEIEKAKHTEIAAELGYTHQNISIIWLNALKKLKKELKIRPKE